VESLFLPEWDAFLRYHDLPGREPARVYLHGLGLASSATFPRVVVEPALAGHRSLLVDLLGFGYSDRPERFGYRLEDHAGTVAALLDRLALDRCALIGHSLGGSVAIALAATRPDLASCLVVAEPVLAPEDARASARIAAQAEEDFCRAGYDAFLADARAEAVAGDASMATFAGAWHVAAPRAIYRTAASLARRPPPTLRELFLQLDIPRAYVYGEQTLRDPGEARHADLLARRGIQVLVVPDAGHFMPGENPAGFAAALHGALLPAHAGVPGGGRA
jgi:pimeloyl-ACP methyl ester carboxylesterase